MGAVPSRGQATGLHPTDKPNQVLRQQPERCVFATHGGSLSRYTPEGLTVGASEPQPGRVSPTLAGSRPGPALGMVMLKGQVGQGPWGPGLCAGCRPGTCGDPAPGPPAPLRPRPAGRSAPGPARGAPRPLAAQPGAQPRRRAYVGSGRPGHPWGGGMVTEGCSLGLPPPGSRLPSHTHGGILAPWARCVQTLSFLPLNAAHANPGRDFG